jgi:transcriptional regulator with XRE-family HTH domain
MTGRELRRRRHQRGLTLWQVARASGTSESTISAYERGIREPSTAALERLSAVTSVCNSSPIHTQRLLTVPAAAATLRRGLRAGWSTADLLRVVREMRSHARLLADADRMAFFAAPSTTGDPRWDALLAGAVEDLFLNEGSTAPRWTAGHALPTFWFVGSTPSLRAYAFARTPISMQVRGVMVDPTDLEAV